MSVGYDPVFIVQVAGRQDGLYAFGKRGDAEDFRDSVIGNGGDAFLSEEPVANTAQADGLIAAERGSDE